jgi:5'-nucleotidase/UDP-sugar diphosphatase
MNRLKPLIALILAFAFVATGPAAAQQTDGAAKSGELVILDTNDSHGAILPIDGAGGLAERASFIKAIRDEYPEVLLLDSGDINTGSALSGMFAGEIDIKAYNMMGYDAVAFGNHEFDRPLQALKAQMRRANFPFLAANIHYKKGGYLGKPYIVRTFGALRVGIFGLTTVRTTAIANPDPSLAFEDEIASAREAVQALRGKEGCDVVIALTHLGLVEEAPGHVTSVKLAEAVAGIDLILDGHSHTYLERPQEVGGARIVSAGEFGKFVGEGILRVEDGKVASFDWKPVAIGGKDAPASVLDPEVERMIAPYRAKAERTLSETIAQATGAFDFGDRLSRKRELALGDLVADGSLWYVRTVLGKKADFAFVNGGSIRAGLPAGAVSGERLATALPFDNWISVATLKGSEVTRLFEYIASIRQGAGGWAQVSGEVRYAIDYSLGPDQGKLVGLTIGGKPVDPEARYTFVTNDYLMAGGDGYAVLKGATEGWNAQVTFRDALIAYARAKKALTPATDGRIAVVGGMPLE